MVIHILSGEKYLADRDLQTGLEVFSEDDLVIGPNGPTDRQQRLSDIINNEMAGRSTGMQLSAIPGFVLDEKSDIGDAPFAIKGRRPKKNRSALDYFLQEIDKFFQFRLQETYNFARAVKSHLAVTTQTIESIIDSIDDPHFAEHAAEYKTALGDIEQSLQSKKELLKRPGAVSSFTEIKKIEKSLHKKISMLDRISESFQNKFSLFKRYKAAMSEDYDDAKYGTPEDTAYRDEPVDEPGLFSSMWERCSGMITSASSTKPKNTAANTEEEPEKDEADPWHASTLRAIRRNLRHEFHGGETDEPPADAPEARPS